MISAIVMASGFSKRLGRDKLRLEFKGKLLIMHTIERLKSAGIHELIVVYRDAALMDAIKDYSVKTVFNENAALGQSESVKLGIMNASLDAEGYMFVVGDQPFMTVETVKQLVKLFREDKSKIVLPICNKRRGNPVIFPASLKSELLNLSGDNGGKLVIDANSQRLNYLEVAELELFDIDTEEDLRRLEG